MITDIKLLFTDTPSRKYVFRKYIYGTWLRILSFLAYRLYPLLVKVVKPVKRPIFIVGCSRSGTDLVTNLFAQHPDIVNWSEAAQLFDLDYYNKDKDDYRSASDVTAFENRRLQILIGLYTAIFRGNRFLNKHPQNSLRIDYLNQMFPDALFIHVIRDGRAVVHSNFTRTINDAFRNTLPFGNFPKPINWRDYMAESQIKQFGYQWRDTVSYTRDTLNEAHLSSRFINIKYEDLCQSPLGIIKQLDKFVGLAPEKRKNDLLIQNITSQNHKWEAQFDDSQINDMMLIISPLLEDLDYI